MKILISGGTGFIGQSLQKTLEKAGHSITILSRSKGDVTWDPSKHWIQENAFENIDAIIHLAGENIGSKRWTFKRKKEIVESRTTSTELLVDAINHQNHQVNTILFASAIGYYGADSGQELCTEESSAGSDFLANCTQLWEKAGVGLPKSIRTVTFRIGLVFDKKEGIFPKVVQPIQWGIGSALGTGKQWQSWIHIEDLCQFFLQGLENISLNGTYNAVGPEPIQQKAMASAIAKFLNKPFFLPAVPGFVLKLILGEMACLVLGGNRVSCNKFVEATQYSFRYPSLKEALKNLI
jgi:uncharacterized protein (TIGR01777 family)